MDEYIDTNIALVYSPDESLWYLDRQEPYNWAVSQAFETKDETKTAYKNGEIEWEIDESP